MVQSQVAVPFFPSPVLFPPVVLPAIHRYHLYLQEPVAPPVFLLLPCLLPLRLIPAQLQVVNPALSSSSVTYPLPFRRGQAG